MRTFTAVTLFAVILFVFAWHLPLMPASIPVAAFFISGIVWLLRRTRPTQTNQ